MFRDEDELRNRVIEWLTKQGFMVAKSIRLGSMELDVVAVASLMISRDGFIKDLNNCYLYTIEVKIATTFNLMFDLVEQAITRLLLSDYVLIAVPSEAEVWVNSKSQKTIKPPQIIGKYASHTYSRKIGIISVDPDEGVKIVRIPQKSGLTQNELKERVLRRLRRLSYETSGSQPPFFTLNSLNQV